MKGQLRARVALVLSAAILLFLVGCIGEDLTGGTPADPFSLPTFEKYPVIRAEVFSFPTGSTPAGFVTAVVQVYWNVAGSTTITDAAVSINGTSLPYNAAGYDYEGTVAIAPGQHVTLNVTAGDQFAVPAAAFGDLLAAALALAAIPAVIANSRFARPLVWIFNIE